tara:strand:- start:5698 stop:9240 length:3543 start_codon:yes stop_codon:yes gene_type:complete
MGRWGSLAKGLASVAKFGTKAVGVVNDLTQRMGGLGLSYTKSRDAIINFNDTLRENNAIFSQFGMGMTQMSKRIISVTREFSITANEVNNLFLKLEKGFTVPPFDAMAESLAMARQMFGYGTGAADKFFATMQNFSSMGPQMESFVTSFVKLQGAALRGQKIDSSALSDLKNMGEQALRLAYMNGKLTRQQYTSRVAMLRVTQRQSAIDAKRMEMSDREKRNQNSIKVANEALVLDSNLALTLLDGQTKAAEYGLGLLESLTGIDMGTVTVEDKESMAAEIDEAIANAESAGDTAGAEDLKAKKDEIFGQDAAAKFKKEQEESQKEILKEMIATLEATAKLNTAEGRKARLKLEQLKTDAKAISLGQVQDKVLGEAQRRILAISNSHKAVVGELEAQVGLQSELNNLLGIVGDLSGSSFEGMNQSLEKQIATAVETIELGKKKLSIQESMLAMVGELSTMDLNSLENRKQATAAMEEELAKARESGASAKEIAAIKKVIKDIEDGNVDALREAEAIYKTQIMTTQKELVTASDRLNVTKQISSEFEFQKDLAATAAEQAGLQVQLADNLAKGVGASVEARLKEADAIGQQISIYREQISRSKEEAAVLKKAIAATDDVDTRIGLKKELEKVNLSIEKTENDTLAAQMKQISALKQLRDGFLEAVSAMTTGAGVFSEIMVEQDKNMGAFMRTTDEAVSVLGTGAASGKGAGLSRHTVGGFERGAAPEGDYDILPDSLEELIEQASDTREALGEGGAIALGMADNQRQLEAVTSGQTSEVVSAIENVGQMIVDPKGHAEREKKKIEAAEKKVAAEELESNKKYFTTGTNEEKAKKTKDALTEEGSRGDYARQKVYGSREALQKRYDDAKDVLEGKAEGNKEIAKQQMMQMRGILAKWEKPSPVPPSEEEKGFWGSTLGIFSDIGESILAVSTLGLVGDVGGGADIGKDLAVLGESVLAMSTLGLVGDVGGGADLGKDISALGKSVGVLGESVLAMSTLGLIGDVGGGADIGKDLGVLGESILAISTLGLVGDVGGGGFVGEKDTNTQKVIHPSLINIDNNVRMIASQNMYSDNINANPKESSPGVTADDFVWQSEDRGVMGNVRDDVDHLIESNAELNRQIQNNPELLQGHISGKSSSSSSVKIELPAGLSKDIGNKIASLVEKSVIEAQKKLVEDGFVSAG